MFLRKTNSVTKNVTLFSLILYVFENPSIHSNVWGLWGAAYKGFLCMSCPIFLSSSFHQGYSSLGSRFCKNM